MFTANFAPITAPIIPNIATGTPIFQFIILFFVFSIIDVIDVGIKKTKFVAWATCWFSPKNNESISISMVPPPIPNPLTIPDIVPVSITYRSNDAILCQLYRDKQLTKEDVDELRKDARIVTYTLMRADKTIVLEKRQLDNEAFIKLIEDESEQIIF